LTTLLLDGLLRWHPYFLESLEASRLGLPSLLGFPFSLDKEFQDFDIGYDTFSPPFGSHHILHCVSGFSKGYALCNDQWSHSQMIRNIKP
jgi:hypothetical protein